MKVELHLHTSRYSGCAVNTPEEMMRRVVEAGYDAVFITEHDAVWPDRELRELRAAFPQVRIFPGMELSIGARSLHHLLVLGSNDPGYLTAFSEREALDMARAAGDLTVLAHPFRWDEGADMLWMGMHPDAIEHRTCNQNARAGDRAEAAADRLDLRLVNAGDVHALDMIDRFWIETDLPLAEARDICGIIRSGAYRNCSADDR